MNVLLSIKPKYADRIFTGEKRYEFRKHTFRQHHVERMYIYSTAPIKKIIGVVDIEYIMTAIPNVLWERCYETAGISKHDFFEYFKDTIEGYAIKMKNIKKFKHPIDPYRNPRFVPPQSFRYME